MRVVLVLGLAMTATLSAGAASWGQAVSLGTNRSSPTQPATTVSRTIVGHVTNAATGAPIGRALVSVNSRSMLTDSRGSFSFPAFTDTQAFAGAQKPGFAHDPEQGDGPRMLRVANLDDPLEIKLFPDGIIRGSVTAPDGLPLARTQVRLRRLTFSVDGARWNNVGFAFTDGRGEYRFRQPAGRYRVTSGFTPRSQDTGEAVLPAAYPPVTATPIHDFFELAGGEERLVDLHPRTGLARPVTLVVDGVDQPGGNLRVTATGTSGVSFPLSVQRSEGGQALINLPSGNYTIRSSQNGRDESVRGSTRVSVTSTGQARALLHLAPTATYAVTASYETAPAGPAIQAPAITSVRQLNLYFENVASDGEQDTADVRLDGRQNQDSAFLLPPGRYRLVEQRSDGWYVRAASSGGVNLLSEDLVVAPGAPGAAIELAVSNAIGTLRGSVTTAPSPAVGWAYMVARTPSAIPFTETNLQPDGTFFWFGKPGAYTLVVTDHQVHENFRDAQFLQRFCAGGVAVEITAGQEAAVTVAMDAGARR